MDEKLPIARPATLYKRTAHNVFSFDTQTLDAAICRAVDYKLFNITILINESAGMIHYQVGSNGFKLTEKIVGSWSTDDFFDQIQLKFKDDPSVRVRFRTGCFFFDDEIYIDWSKSTYRAPSNKQLDEDLRACAGFINVCFMI